MRLRTPLNVVCQAPGTEAGVAAVVVVVVVEFFCQFLRRTKSVSAAEAVLCADDIFHRTDGKTPPLGLFFVGRRLVSMFVEADPSSVRLDGPFDPAPPVVCPAAEGRLDDGGEGGRADEGERTKVGRHGRRGSGNRGQDDVQPGGTEDVGGGSTVDRSPRTTRETVDRAVGTCVGNTAFAGVPGVGEMAAYAEGMDARRVWPFAVHSFSFQS